jgi:hypothetical protein
LSAAETESEDSGWKIQQVKHLLPRDHVKYHHLQPPLRNTALPWLDNDGNFQGAFSKSLKPGVSLCNEVAVWVTKPEEHVNSEPHLSQVQVELLESRGGTMYISSTFWRF